MNPAFFGFRHDNNQLCINVSQITHIEVDGRAVTVFLGDNYYYVLEGNDAVRLLQQLDLSAYCPVGLQSVVS